MVRDVGCELTLQPGNNTSRPWGKEKQVRGLEQQHEDMVSSCQSPESVVFLTGFWHYSRVVNLCSSPEGKPPSLKFPTKHPRAAEAHILGKHWPQYSPFCGRWHYTWPDSCPCSHPSPRESPQAAASWPPSHLGWGSLKHKWGLSTPEAGLGF